MKKVFLDDLPRKGKIINWKECTGYKVKFIYDKINGYVEILKYINGNRPRLRVKYENNEMEIAPKINN